MLKSRIFPFNPFWLAEALKNYILWTLDLLKHSFRFFSLAFSIDIFIIFLSPVATEGGCVWTASVGATKKRETATFFTSTPKSLHGEDNVLIVTRG